MTSTMLRVILRPALNRHGARLHGRFAATLNGRPLCISEATRALIERNAYGGRAS